MCLHQIRIVTDHLETCDGNKDLDDDQMEDLKAVTKDLEEQEVHLFLRVVMAGGSKQEQRRTYKLHQSV